MSKTRIIVHIVFATKFRHPTIPLLRKRDLYKYIYGILENHKCRVLRINGMSDHVHILIDLHPSVALAELVKTIKISTSLWLRNSLYFGEFEAWGNGYYAASVGADDSERVVEYIRNQEEHHGGKELVEEMKEMAMAYHLDWDERDW